MKDSNIFLKVKDHSVSGESFQLIKNETYGFLETFPQPEEAMLSEAFYVKDNSRLGCQIQMTPEMDGLEVELAPEA